MRIVRLSKVWQRRFKRTRSIKSLVKVFGNRVFHADLWHISRESLSTGLALGLFIAFTPTIGFQMLLVTILAIRVFKKVNLPIALLGINVTNAVTFLPALYLAREVGSDLTEGFAFLRAVIHHMFGEHPNDKIMFVLNAGLGLLIFACLTALLGNLLVKMLWDMGSYLHKREKEALHKLRHKKAKENLMLLGNENIEVGVLPEVGGRVVILNQPGRPNVLKEVPELWPDIPRNRVEPGPFAEYRPYQGHIVWVGSQGEWWTQQNLNPERRDKAARWPPDPWIEYGRFQVVHQSNTRLKIVGPDSPISGLRLEKDIRVLPDGAVQLETTATNIRDEEVAWGLWSNMRLDGLCRCLVPVKDEADAMRMSDPNAAPEITMPWEVKDGFFSFIPTPPAGETPNRFAKAMITPRASLILGFARGAAVSIEFQTVSPRDIHPKQAHIEIYNSVGRKPDATLLELEHHGAHKRLKPGEQITLTEKWRLRKYKGNGGIDEMIRFAKTAFPQL
jgi:uncharacterized protein (DUF2062 family)